MGMLVNGIWHQEDPPHEASATSGDGSFVRPESGFRDRVTRDGSSGFKAEAGRYFLVTAPSCPWAHRTVLMRKLKGLEDTIPILQSDLPKGEGWAYSRGFDDLEPVDGVFHVHQVYSAARPDFTGRATVPVLWDRETRTIVNNESSEIIRMLNSEFDEFGDAAVDLYPRGAAQRDRRDQCLCLRGDQQRGLSLRLCQEPTGLRTELPQAVRGARRARAAARPSALSGRRPLHRGRSAAVSDPGAVRRGLLQPLQMQSAAASPTITTCRTICARSIR